jgi:hypothetical protein
VLLPFLSLKLSASSNRLNVHSNPLFIVNSFAPTNNFLSSSHPQAQQEKFDLKAKNFLVLSTKSHKLSKHY